jgi:hypothetical protein
MNEESAGARVQHNITRLNHTKAFTLDGENLARVKRGEHAVPERAQAKSSRLP